jgi:hypothetical protein
MKAILHVNIVICVILFHTATEHSLLSLHLQLHENFLTAYLTGDRLCGLVVRVLGYRSGGPGSIPGTTRKK